jgi:bacteriocin biosynthesis cyclodehydratase domain-containing protein
LVLDSEETSNMVSGESCGLVAGKIDGVRTASHIVDELAEQVAPEVVYYTLMQFEQEGYVVDASVEPLVGGAPQVFWESLGLSASQVQHVLGRASVSIEALDGLDATSLRRSLEQVPVAVKDDGDLHVVVLNNYLHASLAERNREALTSGRPWMLVRPVGRSWYVGPIFQPGSTACWECLAARLRENQYYRGESRPAGLYSAREAALNLAAVAIARWFVEPRPVDAFLRAFDPVTWEAATHIVSRLPQCLACGESTNRETAVRLEPRPKVFRADGGHRTKPPEETVQHLLRHVSPITGIVPRVDADSGNSPTGHTLLRAALNFSPRLATPSGRWRRGSVAVGKGLSQTQAMASCLAEAVERYAIRYPQGMEFLKRPYRDFQDDAIHPNSLLLISPAQWETRDSWNRQHLSLNWLPQPFDEAAPDAAWCQAWSLTHARTRWLPASYVFLGLDEDTMEGFCCGDSNGCAAGNVIEEAVLQGFLELVERDSLALWWYNRALRPGVDLDSYDEPALLTIRHRLQSQGRSLHVLDITTDLEIPTVVAVSANTEGRELLMGFGSHLDSRIAVCRAVTEMTQMWASVGSTFFDDPELTSWFENETLQTQPQFVPAAASLRRATDFPKVDSSDLRDDVEYCVRVAARCGVEVLVQDLSRPEFDLSVVRVSAPGLRPPWARFAQGRLYDVPVALGWVSAATPEPAMNPIPFFL